LFFAGQLILKISFDSFDRSFIGLEYLEKFFFQVLILKKILFQPEKYVNKKMALKPKYSQPTAKRSAQQEKVYNNKKMRGYFWGSVLNCTIIKNHGKRTRTKAGKSRRSAEDFC
jgi:hypothetical protein